MDDPIKPPVAAIEPVKLEKHGHIRSDDYYWLNERSNPEVIRYLEAENAYTNAMMTHTKDLENTLFDEIKNRIKQTDESVPYKLDDHYYYTRFEDKKSYPIYCRKRGPDAEEQVMLDVNRLAEGRGYCRVRGLKVSAGQDMLAYGVDFQGRRLYSVYFKNLVTGEILDDVIHEVTGNMAWAGDNKTLFYTKQEPTTLRWHRIYRHVLGTESTQDELVYVEQDEEFSCWVEKTKSKKYLLIGSEQTVSTEFRYLDADNPEGSFTVFLPRERDHEYSIDHFENTFYIRTNYKAKNFRLMRTPVTKREKSHWKEVIPHRSDVLLEGFEIFDNYLVVEERENGLIQLRIRSWSGGKDHYLDFGEPAYEAYADDNYELHTNTLRFVYSSMTTPKSTFDYDMSTREKILLKQVEVLGGFDAKNYQTERLYAHAKDGARIPISMVYRRGLTKNGGNPLLLYGYGAYGSSVEAYFSPSSVSLLDRGFVYAIAHVRGGEELGRRWYEEGRLLNKKNTFNDFIACAEHLIHEKYTNAGKLFAMGGSAGGLLIGAILNMRPDLFHGAVTRVPFVDVLTTMLDETIPLTTEEYDEWGDPNEKRYYDYILSYSPYDNVEAKDYPHLLVTTGLHDSQVQYWEPAKWVARLRSKKTDQNRLLLKTNMEAGHGGASGRYKRYRETALKWAFLLDLAGYTEGRPPAP
jgi:oligopeptidase B